MTIVCPKCRQVIEVPETGPTNGYKCQCGFVFWVDDSGVPHAVKRNKPSFCDSVANAIGILLLVVVIMVAKHYAKPVCDRFFRGSAKSEQRSATGLTALQLAIEENNNTVARSTLSDMIALIDNAKNGEEKIACAEKLGAVIESIESQMARLANLEITAAEREKFLKEHGVDVSLVADRFADLLFAQEMCFCDLQKFVVSSAIALNEISDSMKQRLLKKYSMTIQEATANAVGTSLELKYKKDLESCQMKELALAEVYLKLKERGR